MNSNLQVFPQIFNGLWLGHSRTFTLLFWSHSTIPLAVCLVIVLLECKSSPQCKVFALWSRFSSRICLYLAPFIVSSILTSLPVPAAEKQPHSMMLPPPCFTGGMGLDGWNIYIYLFIYLLWSWSFHNKDSNHFCYLHCMVEAGEEEKLTQSNFQTV